MTGIALLAAGNTFVRFFVVLVVVVRFWFNISPTPTPTPTQSLEKTILSVKTVTRKGIVTVLPLDITCC